MNLLKFTFINSGLSAAKRDCKHALGDNFCSTLISGKNIQFTDKGVASQVMDWKHLGQQCEVDQELRVIIKKNYLASPERISNLSDVKKLEMPIADFSLWCAQKLGINTRNLKNPAQNSTMVQLASVPCWSYLSIATTPEILQNQVSELMLHEKNGYHVILTLLDFRKEYAISQILANKIEVRWLGELLDYEAEDSPLIDGTFAERYTQHENKPEKKLAFLPAPEGCSWESLVINIISESNSVIKFGEEIDDDMIEAYFVNSEKQRMRAIDIKEFRVQGSKVRSFNQSWLLLREFALSDGKIIKSKIIKAKKSAENGNALSTAKQALAKILAQLFALPAQGKNGPFPRASSKGTTCRFDITFEKKGSVITTAYNTSQYNESYHS